jgi:hypothetical protein
VSLLIAACATGAGHHAFIHHELIVIVPRALVARPHCCLLFSNMY